MNRYTQKTFVMGEQSFTIRELVKEEHHVPRSRARPECLSGLTSLPGGLVVRIRRSHRRGRGSIPRLGSTF